MKKMTKINKKVTKINRVTTCRLKNNTYMKAR